MLTLKYALAKEQNTAFLPFFELLDKAVQELSETKGNLQYPAVLLEYYLNSYDVPLEDFIQKVNEVFNESKGEEVMTLAEQFAEYGKKVWFQEGIEKGIEQGIDKGIEKGRQEGMEVGFQKGCGEGERLVFIRLLQTRFKNIPQHYIDKVNTWHADRILMLTEKLLSANSIEELFKFK